MPHSGPGSHAGESSRSISDVYSTSWRSIRRELFRPMLNPDVTWQRQHAATRWPHRTATTARSSNTYTSIHFQKPNTRCLHRCSLVLGLLTFLLAGGALIVLLLRREELALRAMPRYEKFCSEVMTSEITREFVQQYGGEVTWKKVEERGGGEMCVRNPQLATEMLQMVIQQLLKNSSTVNYHVLEDANKNDDDDNKTDDDDNKTYDSRVKRMERSAKSKTPESKEKLRMVSFSRANDHHVRHIKDNTSDGMVLNQTGLYMIDCHLTYLLTTQQAKQQTHLKFEIRRQNETNTETLAAYDESSRFRCLGAKGDFHVSGKLQVIRNLKQNDVIQVFANYADRLVDKVISIVRLY